MELTNEFDADEGSQHEEATPRVRKIQMEPAEPVDLIEVAGVPALKRIAPIAVGGSLIALVLARRRRRSRRL
jgi:hypothetical protein